MYVFVMLWSWSEAWDEAWRRMAMVRLSIPCVVVGCGRRMGALAPIAFVSSHTDTVDRMSVPAVAMLTPVHRPMLTFKASFLRFVLWSYVRRVAMETRIDIAYHL